MSPRPEAAIHATDLRMSYGTTRVLEGIDLDVRPGEVFAMLGPNGAGKTTTISILTTLLRPTHGSATIAGFDVAREPRRVREVISLTGQFAAVDSKLTGRENLLLMARLHHLPRRSVRGRADELLERFDLVAAADRLVGTYSGGMRRRLDLAISLVARPQVLFLDEPTTGLDPRSRQTVWDLVREVADDGTTTFLTTQYLEEADRLADRIAVIDEGRVVAEGTASQLKSGLGEAFVELVLADATQTRIPTDGSIEHVGEVLANIRRQGLDVQRWQVREPTLDEVFLALTGHRAAPTTDVIAGARR
ncbi:ATP-binding cassette domain-containing protein [Actinotalea sp. K2]|uniref:ATP-binding cassette domain-containing protein n=1 Tax=Actinotalea sp. K2 TaxID=2939438 RepID=UPI002017E062|nr:ATP-binding cassette domain-containing protein [Actinotalea sp. K2]MCL3860930.1 ATP-binding cassette domain-containing protein [Actinotalea sp. K2]